MTKIKNSFPQPIKSIVVLMLLALSIAVPAMGQSANKEWKTVDSLVSNELYATAFSRAQHLFEVAQKQHDSYQILTAAVYLSNIGERYQENSTDASIARFQQILTLLNPDDRALCKMLLAMQYRKASRFGNYRSTRNSGDADTSVSIAFWSAHRLQEVQERYLLSAIADSAALQQSPVRYFDTLFFPIPNRFRSHLSNRNDVLLLQALSMARGVRQTEIANMLLWQHRFAAPCTRLEYDYLRAQQGKLDLATLNGLIGRYRGSGCRQVADLYVKKVGLLVAEDKYLEALTCCDSGYAYTTDAQLQKLFTTYREQIVTPSVSLSTRQNQVAGHDMLATVKYKNADTLYYRIFATTNGVVPKKAKPLKEWHQAVVNGHKYLNQYVYAYLPALPIGEYVLRVSYSPQFDSVAWGQCRIACQSQLIVGTWLCADSKLVGFGMDRATGSPLAGQQLTVSSRKKRVLAAPTLSNDGFFCIKELPEWRETLIISSKDDPMVNLTIRPYCHPGNDTNLHIYQDRPIYKQGDTMFFTILAVSKSNNNTSPRILPNLPLLVTLNNDNSMTADTLYLTTDDFGQCHGSYPIRKTESLISLTVIAKPRFKSTASGYSIVMIEEYKQPKFDVALLPIHQIFRMNEAVPVSGVVTSYSDSPMTGAAVRYSVTRTRGYMSEDSIAGGQLLVDSLGHFNFTFIPTPDKEADLDQNYYYFRISVVVTDVSGETHQCEMNIPIQSQAAYLEMVEAPQVSSLSQIRYRLINANQTPISGQVRVVVQRLQQPAQPKLPQEGLEWANKAYHTLSNEDFARRYPLTTYKEYVDPSPITMIDVNHTASINGDNSVAVPPLLSGLYRVILSTVLSHGDTIRDSALTILTRPDAHKAQCSDLLWSECDSSTAWVGDTLNIRVGSRFNNVYVYYAVMCGSHMAQQGVLRLNDEIKRIPIAITDSMQGQLQLHLFAAKEGVCREQMHMVTIKDPQKQLKINLVSFRQKLTPGTKEVWTLQAQSPHSPLKGGDSCRLQLTLYDATLDTYAPLNWTDHFSYEEYSPNPFFGYAYLDMSTMTYKAKNMAFVEFDAATGVTNSFARNAPRTLSAVSRNAKNEAVMETEATDFASSPLATTGKATAPVFRSHLGTLGFFKPIVNAPLDSVTAISFIAPDLLTTWSLRGLAWTRDMKVGTLEGQAVTRKELMVIPNVPRFLRQGDTVDFMLKVSNLTDSAQQVVVKVDFSSQANTTSHDLSAMVMGSNRQQVLLPARTTLPVVFRLAVPDSINTTFYQVWAEGSHFSDGEQAAIVVLPRRCLINESLAMYANGNETRHYTLPHLASIDTAHTTLQHKSLHLEYVSNPVWYALQSLPYVSQQYNPSLLHTFNTLYANSIALGIADTLLQSGQLTALQLLADSGHSPLLDNEAYKLNLLQESPWLQEAQDETHDIRQWARYLNPQDLTNSLRNDCLQLITHQNSDGGWSWIAGEGASSLFSTSYILRGFGRLKRSPFAASFATNKLNNALDNALDYIDKYMGNRYRNQYKGKKLTNTHYYEVDYLYMRSFYPQHRMSRSNLEAYKFYYRNAKKYYRDYTSLYERAQLALVLHRAGDTRQAQELVRTLKECALVSDEAGMYWRDNKGGYVWSQRPVAVQCMILEAFAEITPADTESVALMQQWLLKQKQTTRWESDAATVDAISALLTHSNNTLSPVRLQTVPAQIEVGSWHTEAPVASQKMDAPTDTAARNLAQLFGLRQHTWQPHEINPSLAQVTVKNLSGGTSWGALYWQYWDDMDKIPYNEMGIKLQRQLYRVEPDNTLTPVNLDSQSPDSAQGVLRVGDKVRVRFLIACERNMEYLELNDGRAASFEPVSTSSGWHWNRGASYYEWVGNTETKLFFSRLNKGNYVVEYDLWVNNSGVFVLAPASMQCFYAPEFKTNVAGQKIKIIKMN